MNELLQKLESSILAGRALHAYLISGTDSESLTQAARRAAALMLYRGPDPERLANDPDYMEYTGAVAIAEFRDVIRPEIYRETYSPAGRIVTLLQAEQLSPMVQNAMLKVLEEPPANTHFILTGNEYGILQTIRSRCMVIRLGTEDRDAARNALLAAGADNDEAERYAAYAGYTAARAVRLYSDEAAMELRQSIYEAFFASVAGMPDYKWTKVKREKREYSEANELLLILCHDLLSVRCGGSAEFCRDQTDRIKKCAAHFTIGQISGIIDKLKDNAERLAVSPSGGACFDRMFSELALAAALAGRKNTTKRSYR